MQVCTNDISMPITWRRNLHAKLCRGIVFGLGHTNNIIVVGTIQGDEMCEDIYTF